jgi:hypothetical protein
LDNLIKVTVSKAIVSRDLRIAEIQLSQACGTSEIPEATSGTEIISVTETISETGGTIIFVVTGKDTSSHSIRGTGIATGTVTVTIGGMVTDAVSLTDRG